MNVVERIRAWRKRRYWEKRHLSFARMLISEDARWLGADWRGERYEKMLSADWYRHPFEDIPSLRRRLGWCPHDKSRTEKHDDR